MNSIQWQHICVIEFFSRRPGSPTRGGNLYSHIIVIIFQPLEAPRLAVI